MISIGFDIGGTFTDFGMFDRKTGRWWFTKVRTTPSDRAVACLEGVDTLLRDSGRPARDVSYIAHGSTVVTNTIIERKGAKTALITTEGFRDVLEIRRQVMPARYDVRVLKPEPLVPRLLRTEVEERVLSDGSIEKPLSGPSLKKLLDSLAADGVESVAICFLHSYANPRNEQEALKVAAAAGDWYVCASHQVMNEFREYERTSTTVANAYVAPPMRHYLSRLESGLKEKTGVASPLLIFQSNGGVVPASQAKETPIACVLSGPASGVIASCAVAFQSSFGDFISLDMGGTSCDVSLVKDNRPTIAFDQDIAGWAIRTPRLDIHTVGAGGGSIAWMDVGQLLRVGPQSAGAEPGPACYGQGGQKATVTDANILLGRLNPSHLLGGRMSLNSQLAREAVKRLASELGLDVDKTAAGILDVVNSTMIRAMRVVSVERGYDPRDFALLAFGGAGPVHAADLARELQMPMVVVPAYPGLLCALGLLVSDLRADGSLTRRMRADDASSSSVIRECFGQVEKTLRDGRAVSSRPNADWQPAFSTDMRYLGQSFELRIPLPEGQMDNASPALAEAFDREHERFYGFATPSAPKEIVCFRVSLQAPAGLKASELPKYPGIDKAQAASHRRVYFSANGWVDKCPVYQRESLALNARQSGPAVVEQMDTTTVVPPDFDFEVDAATNLILRRR